MKKIILGIVLLSTMVFGGQKYNFSGANHLIGCYDKVDSLNVVIADLTRDPSFESFFDSKCIRLAAENVKAEYLSKEFVPFGNKYITTHYVSILSFTNNNKTTTIPSDKKLLLYIVDSTKEVFKD